MGHLLKGSAENLSDERVMEFIDIGSKDDFAGLEKWIAVDQCAKPSERCIVQIEWQVKDIEERLSNEQISSIVRALVAADMKGLYCTGSTTSVHKYLQVLRSRGWPETDELEEWVFANAKNGYISFPPVLGVKPKSSREYYQLMAEKIASHQQAQKEVRDRRVEAGLARFESQRLTQRERSIKRNETLLQMAELPPLERLKAISLDVEHAPYYYPISLLAFSEQEWLSFPIEIKMLLTRKLQHPPRGEWRNLVNHLNELTNNKQS